MSFHTSCFIIQEEVVKENFQIFIFFGDLIFFEVMKNILYFYFFNYIFVNSRYLI